MNRKDETESRAMISGTGQDGTLHDLSIKTDKDDKGSFFRCRLKVKTHIQLEQLKN